VVHKIVPVNDEIENCAQKRSEQWPPVRDKRKKTERFAYRRTSDAYTMCIGACKMSRRRVNARGP